LKQGERKNSLHNSVIVEETHMSKEIAACQMAAQGGTVSIAKDIDLTQFETLTPGRTRDIVVLRHHFEPGSGMIDYANSEEDQSYDLEIYFLPHVSEEEISEWDLNNGLYFMHRACIVIYDAHQASRMNWYCRHGLTSNRDAILNLLLNTWYPLYKKSKTELA
jgi:hypothetical protein